MEKERACDRAKRELEDRECVCDRESERGSRELEDRQ